MKNVLNGMGANREESQIWSSYFQYEGLGNHGNQWHCTSMQESAEEADIETGV